MNAWLPDQCVAYAKAHRHPELTEQTIWEVFEAERPQLVPYAGRFDGFHAVPASVSKTCLVRFDNNKYSSNVRCLKLSYRQRMRGASPQRFASQSDVRRPLQHRAARLLAITIVDRLYGER